MTLTGRSTIRRWGVLLALMLLALTGFQAPDAWRGVVRSALDRYNAEPGRPFHYRAVGQQVEGDAGIIYLALIDPAADAPYPGVIDLLVLNQVNGIWEARFPGDWGYGAAYAALPASLIERINTGPFKPAADPSLVPTAAMEDYALPWAHGEWATVTRSYRAHGRGQIDFDLTGRDVAAARDGIIVYVNDANRLNGSNTGAWWYWNLVVIEHGPHQYALYGHLAPDSVPAWIKAGCAPVYDRPNCAVPVEAGAIIGAEGDTGLSSGPHLHIEFGQAFGIIPYRDTSDQNGDGDRTDWLYTAYIYREHNIAFRGYNRGDVYNWPWGRVEQANHRAPMPVGENLIANPDFSAGTMHWTPSGQVSWAARDDGLHVFRLRTADPPPWATVFQDLDAGAFPGEVWRLTARIANEGWAEKSFTLALINSSGAQYGGIACDFRIPGDAPARTYTLNGSPEQTWAGIRAALSIHSPDGLPALRIESLHVERVEGVITPSCESDLSPAE